MAALTDECAVLVVHLDALLEDVAGVAVEVDGGEAALEALGGGQSLGQRAEGAKYSHVEYTGKCGGLYVKIKHCLHYFHISQRGKKLNFR